MTFSHACTGAKSSCARDCVTLLNGVRDGVRTGVCEQCWRAVWQAYTEEWDSSRDAHVSHVYAWRCCTPRDPGSSASRLRYVRKGAACTANEYAPFDTSKHVSGRYCEDRHECLGRPVTAINDPPAETDPPERFRQRLVPFSIHPRFVMGDFVVPLACPPRSIAAPFLGYRSQSLSIV